MLDSSRRFSTSLGSFSQRAYGALLLVLGLIAIVTPFSAGGWAISILGLIVLARRCDRGHSRPANAIADLDIDTISQAC